MPSVAAELGTLQQSEEGTDLTSYMYDTCGGNISNADVIEKINAILGNTLDLSNLTTASLPTDHGKASMPGIPSSLEHLLSGLSTSVDGTTPPTTATQDAYPGLHPFAVGSSNNNTNIATSNKSRNVDYGTHSQRDFTHPTDTYNQGDYARSLMEYARSQTNADYSRRPDEYNRGQTAMEYTRQGSIDYGGQTGTSTDYSRQTSMGNDYSRQTSISNEYGRQASMNSEYGRQPNLSKDYGRQVNDYSRQTGVDYNRQTTHDYGKYSDHRDSRSQQEYHGRGHVDFMQQRGQQIDFLNQLDYGQGNQVTQDYINSRGEFIQGAISNRTLEQLTEAACTRPYRAIRAEHKIPTTTDSGASPVGAVGDRVISSSPKTPKDVGTTYHQQLVPVTSTPPQADSNMTRLFNRSPSPSDSDTSGIGSECSDTTIIDLMNSLSLTQNPMTTVQPNQPGMASMFANQLQNPLQNTLAPIASQVDILRALGLQQDLSGMIRRVDVQPAIRPDYNLTGIDLNADKTKLVTASAINPFLTNIPDPYAIEKQAKLYRNAASVCEATFTWSGQLPPRVYKNPTYSCKVFLGGVPWDITEAGLQTAFKTFGPMKIEWPGRDGKHPRYPPRGEYRAGYVYVLFESEKSVKALLAACTHDFSNGGEYYFKISSRRMRSKEVQVIPWVLTDSNSVRQPSQRLDPSKTVFVGALHGMLSAEGLAHILNDLFGNVVYAGIDTDKHKYPIGSGRVTFSSTKSYMRAVNAAFVEIKTPKFTKKVQIDPYLEDSVCNICTLQQGPFFCRDLSCFRYYCRTCWQWTHAFETTRHHKPLMRNSRGTPTTHNTVM